MAKTINYPITKTILSAEGSAEVIAYGSNEYTAVWSDQDSIDIAETWSLWSTFPSVVRFGNYVWCWHSIESQHTHYVLIDVVVDVPNELGSNIAYPEVKNEPQVESLSNILNSDGTITATVSDGPYRPLTITNNAEAGHSSSDGRAQWDTTDNIESFTLVYENGMFNDVLISCTTSSDVPIAKGWGDIADLNGTVGDYHDMYGLFAPFATKEQFDAVYGEETDWILQPASNTDLWLFHSDPSLVYDTLYPNGTDDLPDYFFSVAEITPNTLYRDIPGDTTGDGINDTPSLEEALGAYAAVTAALPGLDITKCKFDAKIKLPIPGLDEFSINEQVNKVKAAVTSAVSSTGLLEIGKTAEGLKAGLKSLLPELPQFPNLADELSKLDPTNLKAVQDLKKRWGKAVDNIEGIIDDIQNFDICTVIDKKAKVDENGELSAKAEMPVAPEKPIEEPAQSVYVPVPQDDMPQDDLQSSTGYTPAVAKEAKAKLHAAWQTVFDEIAVDLLEVYGSEAFGMDFYNFNYSLRKDLQNLKTDGPYQTAKTAYNRKATEEEIRKAVKAHGAEYYNEYHELVTETYESLKEKEQAISNWIYVFDWFDKAFLSATKQVTKELKRIAKEGGPPLTSITDPKQFWTPPAGGGVSRDSLVMTGQKIPNTVWATFESKTIDLLFNIEAALNEKIQKHIFGDPEVIKDLQKVMVGDPDENEEPITAEQAEQNCINSGEDCSGDGPEPLGARGNLGDAGFAGSPGAPKEYQKTENVYYVSNIKWKQRKFPIRNDLFAILQAAAVETGFTIEIWSASQKSKQWLKLNDIPRDQWKYYRTDSNTTRHDDGYAADIIPYTPEGRRLSVNNGFKNAKDRENIIKIVKSLVEHGITSVGAGKGYQEGNIHVDISPLYHNGNKNKHQMWGRTHSAGSEAEWLVPVYKEAYSKMIKSRAQIVEE